MSFGGRESKREGRHFLEEDIGLKMYCFLEIVDWREWEETLLEDSDIRTGSRLSKIWFRKGLKGLAMIEF